MPVGQNKTKQGKVLHAVLSEYVGEAAAAKIETAYAGQYKIQIPKCYDVMLASPTLQPIQRRVPTSNTVVISGLNGSPDNGFNTSASNV